MRLSSVRRILKGAYFGFRDRFHSKTSDAILISTHYSVLETDSQHLIRRLPEHTDNNIYVAVDNTSHRNQLAEKLLNEPQVNVVVTGTRSFRKALYRSKLVILKSRLHLHNYRFFSANSSRDYIVFDHGLITKSYKRHTKTCPPKQSLSAFKQRILDWYSYSGIDIQSVCSEVERFFRSSAEGRHPSYFLEYGYPRYDRIDELQEGIEPTIADEDKILFNAENVTNVLYAPTHKDSEYETTLFPFEDFDPEQLYSFLRENKIRLFIRMHPSEEGHRQSQELINNENVYLAGRKISQSSVELLPFVDVLITDYSSIYMDFLPFNRPIVFVDDQLDRFEQVRGIAFNYDRYFPGQKVDTYETFERHLQQIIEKETDGHEDEREFVRKVLLPNQKQTTIDNLLTNYS